MRSWFLKDVAAPRIFLFLRIIFYLKEILNLININKPIKKQSQILYIYKPTVVMPL